MKQDRLSAIAWRDAVVAAVKAEAPPRGADPDLLLDSSAFIDTLDDLVDVPPTVDWLPAAVGKKIDTALATRPGRYRQNAANAWAALTAIDDYVRIAGRVKDAQPIRDILAPLRPTLRAG